ncbi:MAG: histidine kinase, gyrase and HSP90-like ATPase family protein [Polyangiaceae bacterium]|jgi:signal transduction histidine kinase|nr:histidine kinase, gyrase and HSP90-like ATPase family protein [Polyangiaceae bacterium]
MLCDFIIANRDRIIERARERVRSRTTPKLLEATLDFGVPLFLTQLVEALSREMPSAPLRLVGASPVVDPSSEINDSAALHGHELLKSGFSIGQVVHGYGDVCQIVTDLAHESQAAISPQEFHVFNRCLDDAIAGAVTAFGEQRERDMAYEGTERIGVLAHELRNLLNTAVLSFDAIKRGAVGFGGSTSAIHARSLAGLRALADRTLAAVRLEAGQAKLSPLRLADFIEEVHLSAALEAEGHRLRFEVDAVDSLLAIDADRQLLASALFNLLQNAFKYSHAGGTVRLSTRATDAQVLIEVSDACGGLPPGTAEALFRPFERAGAKGPGLGLGLSIALDAVRVHAGELLVRNVPGEGCIFSIVLPRPPPAKLLQVLPDGRHGAAPGTQGGPGRGAHSGAPLRGKAT